MWMYHGPSSRHREAIDLKTRFNAQTVTQATAILYKLDKNKILAKRTILDP